MVLPTLPDWFRLQVAESAPGPVGKPNCGSGCQGFESLHPPQDTFPIGTSPTSELLPNDKSESLCPGLVLCLAERNGRQIDPAFTDTFHERQGINSDLATVVALVPAWTRQADDFSGIIDGIHFYDRQVWHVRPRFIAMQGSAIEPVVQFAEAVGAVRYSDENRWGYRDEGLYVAHCDIEWYDRTACGPEVLNGLFFGAAEGAGGKKGDVGVSVGVRRMQIAPHFLDEDTSRTANIRHGCIQETNHEALIIAAGVSEGAM